MLSEIQWSKRVDNDLQKNGIVMTTALPTVTRNGLIEVVTRIGGQKQCPSLPTVRHNSNTSSKSPSFPMTTFRASLTKLKVLLPHSRDCSYYVSRRTLAPPPL
jgi:hypothetical protein